MEGSAGGRSQLFTIRIWLEELDRTTVELRGQVRHVATGSTQHFREWSDLQEFLASHIEAGKGES